MSKILGVCNDIHHPPVIVRLSFIFPTSAVLQVLFFYVCMLKYVACNTLSDRFGGHLAAVGKQKVLALDDEHKNKVFMMLAYGLLAAV